MPYSGLGYGECADLDPLLRYFERYQKNGHVKVNEGVLDEISAHRHEETERRYLSMYTHTPPVRLDGYDDRDAYRKLFTSNIPTVISTMLLHFWAIPKGAAQSDIVVVLRGGLVPVVLRLESPGSFRYIGPATLCKGPVIDLIRTRVEELPLYLYMLISQLLHARKDGLQSFILH